MRVGPIVDWEMDVLATWRQAAQHVEHLNRDVWSRLPAGVCWFRCHIEAQDIDQLHVIGSEDWREVFGSYKLIDITSAFSEEDDPYQHNSRIGSLIKTLAGGAEIQPIIAVAASGDGPFLIIDGNHRAIAMNKLGLLAGQRCFVGFHQKIETDFLWFRRALSSS